MTKKMTKNGRDPQQHSQIQQASFIARVRVALMMNVKFCIVTDI